MHSTPPITLTAADAEDAWEELSIAIAHTAVPGEHVIALALTAIAAELRAARSDRHQPLHNGR